MTGKQITNKFSKKIHLTGEKRRDAQTISPGHTTPFKPRENITQGRVAHGTNGVDFVEWVEDGADSVSFYSGGAKSHDAKVFEYDTEFTAVYACIVCL
jgi:hypothetical protein